MLLQPNSFDDLLIDRAMQRPVGVLNVNIVRATNLKKKDLLGSSDPYVKLRLHDDNLQSKKTTVKKNNLNPEWNEEFSLIVKDPQAQDLVLTLYDWEKVALASHSSLSDMIHYAFYLYFFSYRLIFVGWIT